MSSLTLSLAFSSVSFYFSSLRISADVFLGGEGVGVFFLVLRLEMRLPRLALLRALAPVWVLGRLKGSSGMILLDL